MNKWRIGQYEVPPTCRLVLTARCKRGSTIRHLRVHHSTLVSSLGILNGNILVPLDILHPLDKSQEQSSN